MAFNPSSTTSGSGPSWTLSGNTVAPLYTVWSVAF